MKPMALNLSQMKKIASDGKSSTFMHPSGHKMIIAHAPLSALHRKQVESLPIHKMAEGGDADKEVQDAADFDLEAKKLHESDQPESSPQQPTQQVAARYAEGDEVLKVNNTQMPSPEQLEANAQNMQQQQMNQQQNVSDAAPYGLGDTVYGTAQPLPVQTDQSSDEEEETPSAQTAQKPEQASQGKVDVNPGATGQIPPASGNFQQAYDQGQQAIKQQQDIDIAKSKANADIQAKDLINRQSLNQGIQQHFRDFQSHQEQFMKDYMDNHINPNHYIENMSTAQKVATGIGLLLGGFTSGFTGRSNPAMDYLNKQIDRDIQSQESRMDQQKTILGANQALFHDEMMAHNQTRINMNDIYDHRIQLAASELGTPQAIANANAAHSKFAMENAALLQQNAMRASVMDRMKQGQGQGLSAVDLGNAGIIPMEQAVKEQGSIDSQNKALASAAEIFKEYDKEQTGGNLLNPQSYARVAQLNAQLTNLIMESDASKRLTPESAKIEVKPFWISTTDSQGTRDAKLRGIANLVRQHAAPTPYMSQYAPKSLPQYDQTISANEGKTATNTKGQKIVMKDGRWVPYGG